MSVQPSLCSLPDPCPVDTAVNTSSNKKNRLVDEVWAHKATDVDCIIPSHIFPRWVNSTWYDQNIL